MRETERVPHSIPRWRRHIVATDPGRVRLTQAFLTALAVMISALIAWALVRFGHADHGLLAVGAFLALFCCMMAKDPTRRGRAVTTALLIIPIVPALALGTVLDRWRAVSIVVFIVIAGTATWLRRFGPRATALGMLTFFGYFFALLMRPTVAELPQFLLVAACAVGSALAMRLVLLYALPRRQITLLLNELRGADAASLAAARTTRPGGDLPAALQARMSRADNVGRTIHAWQAEFGADTVIDCEPATFGALVLDARSAGDQACLGVAALLHDDESLAGPPDAALADLETVLAPTATSTQLQKADARAAERLKTEPTAPGEVVARAVDLATVAHVRLRGVNLSRPRRAADRHPSARRSAAAPTLAPASAPARLSARSSSAAEPWWKWSQWRPTTRMALQVMIAAAIATVIGEVISADRWYWAVLTSFMIFVGTTTRGAVLTKAWRRVVGTVAGVAVGFLIAYLIAGNLPALIVMCVAAVFCMLYFGPLNYQWQAFFVTVLLASLFGLLGVLDHRLLEVRLAETAVGAAVGVACAYLVFSTSSRPVLLAKIDGYFDALDRLLHEVQQSGATPGPLTPVLDATAALDTERQAVRDTLAGMSASLLRGKHALATELERLMQIGTAMAERVARAAATATLADASTAAGAAVDRAVDHVRSSADIARAALVDDRYTAVNPGEMTVADLFADLPPETRSAQADTALALSRLNWALLRAAQVRATP